jgi:hypothetical protein
MTWQKWGSKQALEKRKTSLLSMYGTLLAEKLTNGIQNVKRLTN